MRSSCLRPASLGLLIASLLLCGTAHAANRRPFESWRLVSSAGLEAAGEQISSPGFDASVWQAVSVPNTVVGALVEAGVYEDPYFGMNLRSIPGTEYPIGKRYMLIPTPEDSPFYSSWWYRVETVLPASLSGRSVRLHLDGVNYRANVWVNGTRIADDREVVGTYRRFDFDVTGLLRPGGANAVAVEVTAPEPHDLSFMWVDWNPTPADKNMGLWGDVYLTDSGPIALRDPFVDTDLALPGMETARLTVSVEAWNTTNQPVTGTIRGAIEGIELGREVTLGPGERQTVRFTPDDMPGLLVHEPRVWWPYRWGTPELYSLTLDAEVEGAASDHQEVRFGIRETSSELTREGHRLFRINGRPILIRGGGWASDMLFRPPSRERLEAQMAYVRDMGLNTIRLEGKLETDLFFDLADEQGILLMPGWCCCSQWERWKQWDDEDHMVGPASLRSQALRLRNHPSVFVWLNGSDYPPPADVEQDYLDVLAEVHWPNPSVSNATDAPGPVSGPSGVKMRGPYDYVPPSYWLGDSTRGGAFGFATEIGPGGAVPPVESLKCMLPEDHLWPVDEVWNFHAGGDEFKDIRLFTEALEGRYGKATGVDDFARKAQALAYEGERAMFEAYGRNKYVSTGVIQWMLNDAWPSLIWHLYDYYLRPGGGYYGTKSACEPLHVQYSYDHHSVVVVNDLQQPPEQLDVRARILGLDLEPRAERQATVDVPADGVVRAFGLPDPASVGLSGVYFVWLELRDAAGRERSRNVYWLSTRDDELEWDNTDHWWYTPTLRHADLTALAGLPATSLALSATWDEGGAGGSVEVRNTGAALAFQVHLRAVDGSGKEILPVLWQDNYFALLPGEARRLTVRFPQRQGQAPPSLRAEAWNVPTTTP